MTRLKHDETAIVDVGNVTGLSVRNLIEADVFISVDHLLRDGEWSAVTGRQRLAGGAAFDRTRVELGHERVRVGVEGPDDGRELVEVKP